MLFTRDSHAGLADGSITVTYRRWKRAQVKVGGRYRVGPVVLEVDALCQVKVDQPTDGDARRAGFPHGEALRRRLGHPADGTLVWRVAFHRVGDTRAEQAPPVSEEEVHRRLEAA